jgi:chemotaxis protein MotB
MLILPPESGRTARAASPGWMLTFADLLSLLVAFFVLLFATTSVPQATWQRVLAPVAGYMTGAGIHAVGVAPIAEEDGPARLDLNYVSALVTKLMASEPDLADARLERQDHALILHLPAGFERSRAHLGPLAQLLGNVDNRIELVLHGAIGGEQPAAAWQHAIAEANRVAADFAHLGVGGDVTVTGMADLMAGMPNRLDIVLYDLSAKEAGHAS